MIGVQLQPVDTWFFRDGTPFTQESTPQENVGSLFPPHPPTVVGALRAALARGKGWTGQGRWPQRICDVLGDGPEHLGALSFVGPVLLRNEEPLFRAPRHLLGSTDGARWHPDAFLRPGAPVMCDLAPREGVRLPEAFGNTGEIERLKTSDDRWLTRDGIIAVLRGRLPRPDSVIPDRRLWSDEPRIGLKRDNTRRTAEEGMLYSNRHIRPLRGVSLGVGIDGLPQGWTPPFGELMPLGGESRLAECQEWKKWNTDLALETDMEQIKATGKAAFIALSPVELTEDICRGAKPMDDLYGARVVSACLDRPLRIGGWSFLAGGPLPLRSVLPAGSVLFCEIEDPERFAESVATGDELPRIAPGSALAHVGSRREWGFGLVAVGAWPDEEEERS